MVDVAPVPARASRQSPEDVEMVDAPVPSREEVRPSESRAVTPSAASPPLIATRTSRSGTVLPPVVRSVADPRSAAFSSRIHLARPLPSTPFAPVEGVRPRAPGIVSEPEPSTTEFAPPPPLPSSLPAAPTLPAALALFTPTPAHLVLPPGFPVVSSDELMQLGLTPDQAAVLSAALVAAHSQRSIGIAVLDHASASFVTLLKLAQERPYFDALHTIAERRRTGPAPPWVAPSAPSRDMPPPPVAGPSQPVAGPSSVRGRPLPPSAGARIGPPRAASRRRRNRESSAGSTSQSDVGKGKQRAQ
ncbi:hypothetical protein EIP86_004714 [Pleurotus ostreatoroseus]|nr:hypothetical protein EIP86_004714 [Pleurotus ostreatoroseus]